MPHRPSRAKPWPPAANTLRLDGIAAGTSATEQLAEARKHIAHGQYLIAVVAISDAEIALGQFVHSLACAGSALQGTTWPAAANALRIDGIEQGRVAALTLAEARRNIARSNHLLAVVAISEAEIAIRQLVHNLTLAGSALQEQSR